MIGDKLDIQGRIKSLLPTGWFDGDTPVLDAVLSGIASVYAFVYSYITYARSQTRIGTATNDFLDLVSRDYFGVRLPRRTSEMDTPFRQRILANLFLEKGTRHGVIRALELLTGRTPRVFEPARPADTGGYGIACGYGVAGGYGSLLLPFQVFITAYRPLGQGIPSVAGYGISTGGYGVGSRAEYAGMADIQGQVTDADIMSTIDQAMPVAAVAWVNIQS